MYLFVSLLLILVSIWNHLETESPCAVWQSPRPNLNNNKQPDSEIEFKNSTAVTVKAGVGEALSCKWKPEKCTN